MRIPVIIPVLLTLICASAQGALENLPLPAKAVARIASARVVVTPDRLDWTYSVGDPVLFSVSVLVDGQELPGAKIKYMVGPEKFEEEAVEALLPEGILKIAGGTLEEPGFLRCMAIAEIGGKTYKGLATAAFDPLEIEATQTEPEDFEAYWTEQLGLISEMPLDLRKTLVPDQCSSDVNVYHVSYQTYGRSGVSRFYGMLAEPKLPGKYPAILRVPGAGVRPYTGNTELASEGAVVLTVGIHGIPVDHEQEIYDELRRGALNYYPHYNLSDRDQYYYHRVVLGCVRGNDVLAQHPMWDGERLVVIGGSQGGMLSIVTTSLDHRVTGVVSNYPAYCDVTGYLYGRAGGWPHIFRKDDLRTPENFETSSYYDVVNFAKRLTVPGSYAWGYNDETCPPTSMFAAYNAIAAPKELHLQLDMGHRGSSEFYDAFTKRVLIMAGLKQ